MSFPVVGEKFVDFALKAFLEYFFAAHETKNKVKYSNNVFKLFYKLNVLLFGVLCCRLKCNSTAMSSYFCHCGSDISFSVFAK